MKRHWLFATLCSVACASDGNYYPPGISNPNTDNPLYYRNAIDVLKNLGSFRALYVRHESCA